VSPSKPREHAGPSNLHRGPLVVERVTPGLVLRNRACSSAEAPYRPRASGHQRCPCRKRIRAWRACARSEPRCPPRSSYGPYPGPPRDLSPIARVRVVALVRIAGLLAECAEQRQGLAPLGFSHRNAPPTRPSAGGRARRCGRCGRCGRPTGRPAPPSCQASGRFRPLPPLRRPGPSPLAGMSKSTTIPTDMATRGAFCPVWAAASSCALCLTLRSPLTGSWAGCHPRLKRSQTDRSRAARLTPGTDQPGSSAPVEPETR